MTLATLNMAGRHCQRPDARCPDLRTGTAVLWRDHGITSLAQYYTSKIKYDPDLFVGFSTDMEALLRERGFL